MNVLVIGSGGREHALCWKIKQSPRVKKIICIPGNAGIAKIAGTAEVLTDDFAALADFATKNAIDLTVVGPEIPLAAGIVDYFRARGLAIFGPDKRSAQLEASKVFAKKLMQKYGIPTARFASFNDFDEVRAYLASWPGNTPLVVKADGLAAGKGVIICKDAGEAIPAIERVMKKKEFGAAGNEVIIEEFLEGEEASLQLFLDGKNYQLMPPAQDHKRVFDSDLGPNTGGMGTYAPAPLVTPQLQRTVETTIISPLIEAFTKENINYKGVLYVGIMVSGGKPYVLEFNCRFGDPETQVVLPLLKTDLVEIMESVIGGRLGSVDIQWHDKSAVCVILASGGYPGSYAKGKTITGLDEAVKLPDTFIFHAGTAMDAGTGNILTDGGRVLGVTGMGGSIPDAVKAAYRGVDKIKFEGMHFRRDIAGKALK